MCAGRNAVYRDETLRDTIFFMKKVPLFRRIEPSDLPMLASAIRYRLFYPGEQVLPLDPGDELFIIRRGSAPLLARTENNEMVKLTDLFVGDYFGGGFGGTPKHVQAEALNILEVMSVLKKDVERLRLGQKLTFKRRHAYMGAMSEDTMYDVETKSVERPKTTDEREALRACLLNNAELAPLLAKYGEIEIRYMIDQAQPVSVTAGEVVVKQDDVDASKFYMITEGELEVTKLHFGESQPRSVLHLEAGGSFGELALLFQRPRAATVTAETDAQLWSLSRNQLKTILMGVNKMKLERYGEVLRKVGFLKELTSDPDIRMLVASSAVEITACQGQYVVRQGEEGASCYILFDGQVDVEVDGKVAEVLEATSADGEAKHFSEYSPLMKQAQASVRVTSESASFLVLNSGSLQEAMQDTEAAKRMLGATSNSAKYDFESLQTLGVLGTGGFGVVNLVQEAQTGRTFALKTLCKGYLAKAQQEKGALHEKEVLSMTKSPFIVKLYATFSRDGKVHFLLESVLGGDLATMLQRHDLYGSVVIARFYTACTMRGLMHLHERQIMYRDLKTENVLLSAKGYCKLTDFGLAKLAIGPSYTMCGTMEYLAPEMVLQRGHTKALDWWALGILLYEMMMGVTPFASDSPIRMSSKIIGGLRWHHFPNAKPWTQLVQRFCDYDPRYRWGIFPDTYTLIEECAFFTGANFDWQSLDTCNMRAPFVPTVNGGADIQNFEDGQALPESCKYVGGEIDWDRDFENPYGPTYS